MNVLNLNQNKMTEQRVVILPGTNYADEQEKEINEWLEKGWQVVSVTANHVATAASNVAALRGGYLIVIEKPLTN